MPQDRIGDLDHVARKPPRDRGWRAWVRPEFFGDGCAGLQIDRVDQPQRKFGVVTLFLGRVRRLLDIEVGEDAQQSRLNVDTIAPREAVEPLKLGKYRRHKALLTVRTQASVDAVSLAAPR